MHLGSRSTPEYARWQAVHRWRTKERQDTVHFCTESVHELVAAECWNLHFDAGMWFARATVRRTTWAEVVQELSRADPDTWQDFDGCDAWLASVRDDHRRVRMRFDAAARVVQRAWRRHRALKRKRAAIVIEDAVLRAMYRPGGWLYPAVQSSFVRLSEGEGAGAGLDSS